MIPRLSRRHGNSPSEKRPRTTREVSSSTARRPLSPWPLFFSAVHRLHATLVLLRATQVRRLCTLTV